MPRMKILSKLEQEIFDSPPVLSSFERKRCFDFPNGLLKIAASLRTPANSICFLAKAGYFKATKKFFAAQFHSTDLEYIAQQRKIPFSELDIGSYDKQTALRHRHLILDFYGFSEFDLVTECNIGDEITTLIRARLKPKLIFFRIVDSLIRQRVAVPSCDLLSRLILEQLREYKANVVSLLAQELSETRRKQLDELLERVLADNQTQSSERDRYRLTLLKKFSQSTKPSKIKASTQDLLLLQSLYQEFEPVIEKLNLTSEGIRHYAGSVIRSKIFQLTRRSEPDRYLHLLAFIAHQYFGLQDTLVDVLLRCVQAFSAQRAHKEIYYEHRQEHKQQLRSLVQLVDDNVMETISRIKTITHCELSDAEKVEKIKALLDQIQPQQQLLQSHLEPLKNEYGNEHEDADYYRIVEQRSVKLQNRVVPIIKTLTFSPTASSTALMSALNHFKSCGHL